jgi:hypothetical protein
MQLNRSLTVASLLTIVFSLLHVADDIAIGIEKGGPSNLVMVPILVTFLFGVLLASVERRSGYVIVLLGSLLSAYVPVLHFQSAAGVAGGKVAASGGAFFFVWTLLALGVCAVFSVLLSVYGLWKLQWGRPRKRELESR